MQNIEPFSNWESLYTASADRRSPFYGRRYHDTLCTNTIYNYYIHPAWDEFGSPTLYMKVLYADYNERFCIIELLGEWNDCIHNDVMFLKRNVADVLIAQGIRQFILIGENVLDYHGDTTDYYEEWFEDIEEGFVLCLNFRSHVAQELTKFKVDNYLLFGGRFNEIPWRRSNPLQLFRILSALVTRRLNP